MMRTAFQSYRRPAASRRAAGRKAFTLLELLVATLIFSIVVVAINTVFFASLHLRRSVSDALEQAVPLDHALALIRRDLQNAVAPGGVLAGHFRSSGPAGTLVATAGGGAASSSTSSGSGLGATANTIGSAMGSQYGGLDFFTTTGTLSDDAPWGDIQEVNYQLVRSEQPDALGQDLVRSVTRNLLTYLPAPETQLLCSNVELLEFEYYDGTQWRDSWDTTAGDTSLPQAVRLRLQLAAERTATVKLEPLEILVLLNPGSGTNTTASADIPGEPQ